MWLHSWYPPGSSSAPLGSAGNRQGGRDVGAVSVGSWGTCPWSQQAAGSLAELWALCRPRWTQKFKNQANKLPEEAWIQEHDVHIVWPPKGGGRSLRSSTSSHIYAAVSSSWPAFQKSPSQRSLGAAVGTVYLSALLTPHSLLDLDVLYRKINGFLKNLIQGSFIFDTIFFSVSLNCSKSCSKLLLNLMEKKHIKDHGSGLPWSPDLTQAFIFHLFCFIPKGQFHSRFMSLYWKTIEHFQSHKILWNHKSNALDPKLNLRGFFPTKILRYLTKWKVFQRYNCHIDALVWPVSGTLFVLSDNADGEGNCHLFLFMKVFKFQGIENNFLPYKCSFYCTICSLIICGNPIPFEKSLGFWMPLLSHNEEWSLPPLCPSLLGGSEQGGSEENTELLKPDCCVHLGTAATGKVHGRGTFVPTIEIISLEKYFA